MKRIHLICSDFYRLKSGGSSSFMVTRITALIKRSGGVNAAGSFRGAVIPESIYGLYIHPPLCHCHLGLPSALAPTNRQAVFPRPLRQSQDLSLTHTHGINIDSIPLSLSLPLRAQVEIAQPSNGAIRAQTYVGPLSDNSSVYCR
ncbi:hypothetical protein J6590_022624 [Homalodisca vitripennis]|nr:hypothetical protein J6590_022624 [Homalodisca vitripennis]